MDVNDFKKDECALGGEDDGIDYDKVEVRLDPDFEAFLDADTFREKLDIFYKIRDKADARMLSDIAISLDLDLEDKPLEDQYIDILNCLRMMEKYECTRLRP